MEAAGNVADELMSTNEQALALSVRGLFSSNYLLFRPKSGKIGRKKS